MPKISKNNITIYNEHLKKDFEVVVMYNQKHLFYAEIPEEFKDIVHHFDKSEMEKFHITKDFGGGIQKRISSGINAKYKAIVIAGTEGECLKNIKQVLSYCVGKSVQMRPVIILFYQSDKHTMYNEHHLNNEHPIVHMEMGLTYCTETSVGDKKVYSIYTERDVFGKKEMSRRELSLWGRAATIIPDTPENRETLETLYFALQGLRDKIKSFTSTPEKLIEFIESKQNLLPSSNSQSHHKKIEHERRTKKIPRVEGC
jgi:hypothetical protein